MVIRPKKFKVRSVISEETGEVIRVRLPNKEAGEVIGRVIQTMGAGKFKIDCFDGFVRTCRIPGRLKKKMWIREGDTVIVVKWEVQANEKGDVIWRYTGPQVSWLEKNGYIPREEEAEF
jgi:translation initiation factor 1A